MIATFGIEIACAVYTVWRYKLNSVTRLAALTLICLAVFQLAEFNVCEGAFGMSSLDWARVGYVAITLLPPFGIHLILRMSGRMRRTSWIIIGALYTIATVFAAFFLFSHHGMASSECMGNYVIFAIMPSAVKIYGLYYYGIVIGGTILAVVLAQQTKAKNLRVALYSMAVGYLAFLIPTTTANVIDPSTMAGIPSIMCGFAVIFALIMTFVTLPRWQKAKGRKA